MAIPSAPCLILTKRKDKNMDSSNFDFEGFIDSLAEFIAVFDQSIDESLNKGFADSISTPIGQFFVETAPFPDFMKVVFGGHNWGTVVGVDKDDKTYGPVGVEFYDDEESAMQGHNEWRRLIMDTPPCILKDGVTGKVTYIPV